MNGVEIVMDNATKESFPLLDSLSMIHSIIWYDVFEDGARTREVEELSESVNGDMEDCHKYGSFLSQHRQYPMMNDLICSSIMA